MSNPSPTPFSELKPGDKVVVSTHLQSSRIETVLRITPSGRIVTTGGHLNQMVFDQHGRARGYSGWRRPYLEVATPELLACIKTAANRERLARARWDTLPADFINTVAFHLDEELQKIIKTNA